MGDRCPLVSYSTVTDFGEAARLIDIQTPPGRDMVSQQLQPTESPSESAKSTRPPGAPAVEIKGELGFLIV